MNTQNNNVNESRSWSLERSTATALDIADPLARQRAKFHLPINTDGNPQTYLCGHSLGLQPKSTAGLINEELLVWQTQAVEGHFGKPRPWLSYHELLTPGLAELTGALPIEVVAMNSLSVNLHLLLTSFYRPTTQRRKILIEASAFPSDRYAVCSQLQLHGYDPADNLLELRPRAGEDLLRTEDIVALLEHEGASIATVLLPGVQYLTGQWLDLPAISRVAQQQGCTVGIDLAHAIGNVPLQLHDWNIDFAVWCSYKYLNSGPGSIGGAFVHERHAHNFDLPRLAGWWGHDKTTRFNMPQNFVPLPGAEGWQLSNPPILACAPLLASLQIFQDAGIKALRKKSLQLTAYLEHLLQAQLAGRISLITPKDAAARGCQLSLRLHCEREQARKVHQQLLLQGLICDWREPDVIRVTPIPLYNRHVDVWQFVQALQALLA
ncbi:MAG: kynureninase [Steroidobacteraceae bacterium]